MNRFEDVFRPFLQGNAAQQLMRAPIHHIDAKREKRQITVELHPEQRIPMEEITRVEKQIMQTANLALFEIMTRYRPELFCCESMEDILHELRKRGYPANGIFEGSGQKLENGTLTISLRHGGYNLIQQSGCDKAIQHLIGQQYGMAVDVRFDGCCRWTKISRSTTRLSAHPACPPSSRQHWNDQRAHIVRCIGKRGREVLPTGAEGRTAAVRLLRPAAVRAGGCGGAGQANQGKTHPCCRRWTARPVRPPSGEILFARNR